MNSATNPLMPGNPREAMNPAIIRTANLGMRSARPPRSAMTLVPTTCCMVPADMNRTQVMIPCENCWNMAPVTDIQVKATAPRVTNPMWLTEE